MPKQVLVMFFYIKNFYKYKKGINALNTPIQKKKGIHDSFESFKEDTLKFIVFIRNIYY